MRFGERRPLWLCVRETGSMVGPIQVNQSSAASYQVDTEMEGGQASLALSNLRGIVILVVLGFHSMLAYLGSLGPMPFAFAVAPYEWRAFPIVDSHRWYGFDILCAWQDVYLMALMFFLSALFTWPSLSRKGTRAFLTGRLVRLGVPFVFAVTVVIPLAIYPVYLATAVHPGPVAYLRALRALPFWPDGPMWFLWQLLVLTALAAGLHRFAPGWIAALGRWSVAAAARPERLFAVLAAVAVLAYVPPALAFTPWAWSEHGPFALQYCRPGLYAVFYLAGLGVGAGGLGRGLLAPAGALARHWNRFLAGSAAALALWMGLTALTMRAPPGPLLVQLGADIAFALTCTASCLFMIAACLRFAVVRSRVLASLSRNALGMYVLHYAAVVWLQYALLGLAWFAVAKAGVVFAVTVALSWGATIGLRRLRLGAILLGEPPPRRSPVIAVVPLRTHPSCR